ncbi:MAG: Hpt domain-containing protein, partial [Oscillospiraceae bacterium]
FGAEKLSKIQKHFDEKNIADYTTEVHSLKSSAANIGAMELSALAKELEFAGKDNKLDIIESKTGRLLEMFSKLLNDIGKVLEDRNNK